MAGRPWWALLALLAAGPAAAQIGHGAFQDPALALRPDSGPAPVVLLGDTVFVVASPVEPFSPRARATQLAQQLEAMLRRRLIPATITVVDALDHTDLLVDGRVLYRVVDDDARAAGRPRLAVAQGYADRILGALVRAPERQRQRLFGRHVLIAGAATAGLLLLLTLLRRGVAGLHRRLERLRDSTREWETIRHLEVVRHLSLLDSLMSALRVGRLALTAVLVLLYLPLVLNLFPQTAEFSHQLTDLTLAPLQTVGRALGRYLPNLLYIVLIIAVMRYLLRLAHLGKAAVQRGELRLRGFHPEWAEPTYVIVRVLLLAITVAMLFPYLPGAKSDGFKGVSIFLGLLLSLGSSSAVSSLIAGTVLTYTRAFRVGDRVAIGDTVGDVLERSFLVTRVRTIKNVDVTIPNGVVLTSNVANYTSAAQSHGLILHATVAIGYNTDWREVHRLLLEAARQTPRVLGSPPPFVLQTALADYAVSYELNAYTDAPGIMHLTSSALLEQILDAFAQAEIEIMTPAFTALRDGSRAALPQLPGSVPNGAGLDRR